MRERTSYNAHTLTLAPELLANCFCFWLHFIYLRLAGPCINCKVSHARRRGVRNLLIWRRTQLRRCICSDLNICLCSSLIRQRPSCSSLNSNRKRICLAMASSSPKVVAIQDCAKAKRLITKMMKMARRQLICPLNMYENVCCIELRGCASFENHDNLFRLSRVSRRAAKRKCMRTCFIIFVGSIAAFVVVDITMLQKRLYRFPTRLCCFAKPDRVIPLDFPLKQFFGCSQPSSTSPQRGAENHIRSNCQDFFRFLFC